MTNKNTGTRGLYSHAVTEALANTLLAITELNYALQIQAAETTETHRDTVQKERALWQQIDALILKSEIFRNI